MEKISIENHNISDKSKPFIAAEIGLNHNKNLNLTKKMILSAKENGADAVKFQTYITEKLVNRNSPAFDLFKNLELTKAEFIQISQFCRDIDITFFSTPFCIECVSWLEELNVPCYKIASMDINYFDLIAECAKTGKPIILSTGMSTLGDIEKAIEIINQNNNNKIIILHTISKYPPEHKDMNMNMITKIKNIFNCPVGFSDHTIDNTSSVVARVLGAVFFEKHFTLDKKLDGPDHSISLEPQDLADLRIKLDIVDKSLIENKNRSDLMIKKGARRSLYINTSIKKGTKITRDMIDIIRPEEGLAPEYIDFFTGRTALCDMEKGSILTMDSI